jgi:hypothetical protein
MIVKAPPKLSAVTLWIMSKTGRWAPSPGPMKTFLLAATERSLPLRRPNGVIVPGSVEHRSSENLPSTAVCEEGEPLCKHVSQSAGQLFVLAEVLSS